MPEELNKMKPIWFYVGWIILIIGAIVLTAGIYYLFVPMHHHIELPGLHINIWWGLILMLGGVLLIFVNRKPMDI